MLNQLIIQGNLTKDPEIKYLQSGTAVMECSLACKETIQQSNGVRYDETTFIDFVFWGGRGEAFYKFFKKGDEVLITGKLKLNQWESNGVKMKKHKLKGETFNFTRGGTKRIANYNQQSDANNYSNQPEPYIQSGSDAANMTNQSEPYIQSGSDAANMTNQDNDKFEKAIPEIDYDEIPF